MDAAKIRLSKEELALVMDPAWILTKNSIMRKVGALFGELSVRQQEIFGAAETDALPLADGLPGERNSLPLNWATPKISRGENYKGLPYMVLDYPRAFGREDVLAIRTLFWWGHYFSVTLHLKGRYKTLLLPVIKECITPLAGAGFHVNVSEDEWRHELDPGHYVPLQGDNDTILMQGPAFLKLSAKCGLDRWDDAGVVLLELFSVLMEVVSSPTGGRGLSPGSSRAGSGL